MTRSRRGRWINELQAITGYEDGVGNGSIKRSCQVHEQGARRRGAYAWLADQIGIDTKNCHIGMMD